jgi:ketosteroid isomerase-like protein
MISDDDIARLTDWYRRFNRGERETLLAELPPEIEWIAVDAGLQVVRLRGREAVGRYLSDAVAPLDTLVAEPLSMTVGANRVFVTVEQRGRQVASDQEARFTFGHEWTFRNGALHRFRLHLDPRRARRVAPQAGS